MTAEIAILNRSAVAIAADSAVTISVGDAEKIYNSAEKIFDFSRISPIGLMIYNSLDFMGFLWDVLIRRFRKEQDELYGRVSNGALKFETYLSTLNISEDQENSHLSELLEDVYRDAHQKFMERLTALVADKLDAKNVNAREVFHDTIKSFIQENFSANLLDFLSGKTQEEFNSRYGSICKRSARRAMFNVPLHNDKFNILQELAFAFIKSNVPSSTTTGLVFVGYAKDDFLPSIYSANVDGKYFRELKIWETDDREIDRDKNRAIIAPFAQREMVDRFVYGVDQQFEHDLGQQVKTITAKTVEKLLDFLNKDRRRKLKLDSAFITDLAMETRNSTASDFLENLKSVYLREVYDLVTAMPKAELAQMAEALVSLTSMKRRVSLESETVGGPVDVAIITRSEGFIWVKRKQYFEKGLNPGFVMRHYPKERKNGDVDEGKIGPV